jgi:hypothetical protein
MLWCSEQPGQAHLTPQVHPDPAKEVNSLMGGIEGKSGIGVEDKGDEEKDM